MNKSVRPFCRALVAAFSAVSLASCGAASIVRRPVLPPLPPRLGQGSGQQLLYVGNSNNNTVTVYDFYAGTLLRTISGGVNNPLALAVDKIPQSPTKALPRERRARRLQRWAKRR